MSRSLLVEDLLLPSVACPAALVEELRQVHLEVALVPFSDERLGQHYGKRIPGCAAGWLAFGTRDK